MSAETVMKSIILRHKELGKVLGEDAGILKSVLGFSHGWALNPGFRQMVEDYSKSVTQATKTIFSFPSPIKAGDVTAWATNRHNPNIYNPETPNAADSSQEMRLKATVDFLDIIQAPSEDLSALAQKVIDNYRVQTNTVGPKVDRTEAMLHYSLAILVTAHSFVRTFPWLLMYFNVYFKSLKYAFISTRWKAHYAGSTALNTNTWRQAVKGIALEYYVLYLTSPEWWKMLKLFGELHETAKNGMADLVAYQSWGTASPVKISQAMNNALAASRIMTKLIRISRDFILMKGQQDIREVMASLASYKIGDIYTEDGV